MFLSTTDIVPGRQYQILGLVKGNVAYTRHIGRDIMAGFKNIAGGEIISYTELVSTARDMAEARMMEEAGKLGADGVVAVRLQTSSIEPGTIEAIAYGTAVKLL